MKLLPAGAADRADIESLLDDAFGADRHTRTAYRLRDGVAPFGGLSMVARDDSGRLVGSIQYWPIELWDGVRARPLTLLGPVAVAPDQQGTGVGKRLMTASLEIADACDHEAIVLIGDPEYYGRWGFEAGPTADWAVPGPVERRRLLARIAPGVTLAPVGELRRIRSMPAWARLPLPVRGVPLAA